MQSSYDHEGGFGRSPNTLTTKLQTLFNNPAHSDIQVHASDGVAFHAHMMILNLHTVFFKTALSSGSFKESDDKIITLPEHSARTVENMLRFCYSGDYDLGKYRQVTEELVLDPLRTYVLADYVIMPELKVKAIENIKAFLMLFETISKRDNSGRDEVWERMIEPLVENVYLLTNDDHQDIRQVVVEGILEGLLQGYPREPLMEILNSNAEFSAALLALHLDLAAAARR